MNLDETEINATIDQMLLLWPDIPIDETVTETDVKKEALFWKQKCEKAQEKPKSFIEALNSCPKSAYPHMHKILKIGAVIPVTSSEPERSFSTLKRLKTYLRNSTGEFRLNGLAALSIHRDIKISSDEIIDRFGDIKKRRIKFTLEEESKQKGKSK